MTSTDLADDVTSTAEALQKAREELEASRTAVAAADASLAAYEARARSGLSVTAGAFGDRRAQVELSRMTMEAAEARADAAEQNHRFAVAAHAADVIVSDDRVNGSRETEVRSKVERLVAEAVYVAKQYHADRNAGLAEVRGLAASAGLPTATKPIGGDGSIVLENPLAPVAIYGSGLWVEGRTVTTVDADKAARAMVTKAVESLGGSK